MAYKDTEARAKNFVVATIPTGVELVPGPPGKDGAPGRDGRDGEQGPPGKDGAAGRDGRDGEQGPPGKDGAPGRDGRDGEPGKDGAPGRDGVAIIEPGSITGDQIAQGTITSANLAVGVIPEAAGGADIGALKKVVALPPIKYADGGGDSPYAFMQAKNGWDLTPLAGITADALFLINAPYEKGDMVYDRLIITESKETPANDWSARMCLRVTDLDETAGAPITSIENFHQPAQVTNISFAEGQVLRFEYGRITQTATAQCLALIFEPGTLTEVAPPEYLDLRRAVSAANSAGTADQFLLREILDLTNRVTALEAKTAETA